MQYINPCWQPIGGIQYPGGLDTVIGVTSFIPQRDYSNSIAHCADRNGIPYSYFASTQPAWDWIYETIDGKPLLLKSKMNHTRQNGCGNKAVFVCNSLCTLLALSHCIKPVLLHKY